MLNRKGYGDISGLPEDEQLSDNPEIAAQIYPGLITGAVQQLAPLLSTFCDPNASEQQMKHQALTALSPIKIVMTKINETYQTNQNLDKMIGKEVNKHITRRREHQQNESEESNVTGAYTSFDSKGQDSSGESDSLDGGHVLPQVAAPQQAAASNMTGEYDSFGEAQNGSEESDDEAQPPPPPSSTPPTWAHQPGAPKQEGRKKYTLAKPNADPDAPDLTKPEESRHSSRGPN